MTRARRPRFDRGQSVPPSHDTAFEFADRPRSPTWQGYLVAILLEGVLAALLQALRPYLPLYGYPFPFVIAVMAVAYLYGEGPAALAFFLGLLLFVYLFVAPFQALWPIADSSQGWAQVVGYLTGTLIVGLAMLRIRQVNRRLQESQRILQAILDHVPEGISVAEAPHGAIRAVSRYGRELLGLPQEAFRDLTLDSQLERWVLMRQDGSLARTEDLPLARALGRGEVVTNEEWLALRPDGEQVPLLYNAGPVLSAEGRVLGAVAAWHDIREIRKARRTLEEALHRERYIAELLQRALLPSDPAIGDGYLVATAYVPALSHSAIGGDFYDLFRTLDGKTAILIGDVSGKGVEGAALAAAARSTIRAFAYETSSPNLSLARANAALHDQPRLTGSFITVLLAVLNPATGELEVSGGGHPPALLSRADGSVEALPPKSLPLGVLHRQEYAASRVRLGPGDRLVLYTDGISEVRLEGRMFSTEGITRSLVAGRSRPPRACVEQLLADARAWGGGGLVDDAAVVLIERQQGLQAAMAS